MTEGMDIDQETAPRKRKRQTAAAPQPKRHPAARQPAAAPEAQAMPAARRASPRAVPPRAEAARDVVRENPRDGAIVALSRDGQRLTRRRIASGDPLDVPKSEIPHGWDYQWNPVTVLNKGINEVLQGDLLMHQNGWRPVPASRHAGRWTPVGFEGDIVVQGLRLEERPMSLSQEAKAEDEAIARAQVRDRTDALKMTQKQLPGAGVARARGHGGGLKIDFNDDGHDIPRPQHELDPDEV
jgi:hypothetical protein